MADVSAFGCEMQYVGWIYQITTNPIRDILAEWTAGHRCVSGPISLRKIGETGCRPVPHRNHYGVLIHGEFGAKRKMKTPLPRVAEAVRPLAGSAVSFVPNVLLCPQPARAAHRQDHFQHVRRAFTPLRTFFDIDNQRAIRAKHPLELLSPLHPPIYVLLGRNAAVVGLARI